MRSFGSRKGVNDHQLNTGYPRASDMMVSPLFRVSDDWLPHLLTWLDLNSICHLDIAICNRDNRHLWINSLTAVDAIAINEHRQGHSSIRWMISRHIKVKTIRINAIKAHEITGGTFLGLASTWIRSMDLSDCINLRDADLELVARVFHPNVDPIDDCFHKDALLCEHRLYESDFALSKSCFRLQAINLSGCLRLSKSSLFPLLRASHNLTSIDLEGCKNIADISVLTLVHSCPFLSYVNLAHCKGITDISIAALAECCPGLRTINLSGCNKLTDKCLLSLADHCLQMGSIDLTECCRLTDVGITAIALKGSQLRAIYLCGCNKITDISVSDLGRNCSFLSIVDLAHCCRVTDVSVVALAKNCFSLLDITLSFCSEISDIALSALSLGCPQITNIYLHSCCKITDLGVSELGRGCTNITDISLSQCENITDMSICDLGTNLPLLINIDISNCTYISNIGVSALAQGCLHLKHINLTGCDPVIRTSAHTYRGDEVLAVAVSKFNSLLSKPLADNDANSNMIITNHDIERSEGIVNNRGDVDIYNNSKMLNMIQYLLMIIFQLLSLTKFSH